MRQQSEWLVAMDADGVKILKAAFSLTSKVPNGAVHKTQLTLTNKDFVVHWYCHKPQPIIEENIYLITLDWLADGRLG